MGFALAFVTACLSLGFSLDFARDMARDRRARLGIELPIARLTRYHPGNGTSQRSGNDNGPRVGISCSNGCPIQASSVVPQKNPARGMGALCVTQDEYGISIR